MKQLDEIVLRTLTRRLTPATVLAATLPLRPPAQTSPDTNALKMRFEFEAGPVNNRKQ